MAKRRRISRTRAVPVDDAPTPSPSISASEHAQRQPNCVEALYPCRHILLQHMDSETRASWRLTCKQAAADVYEATTCLTWAKGEPTVCDILPRDLFEVAMQLLLPLELIKPKQPGPRTLALLSKLPGLEQLTCAVAPLRLNGLHQGIRKLDLGYCGELSSFVPVRACSALQSLRLHGAKHDAVQHRKSSTLAAVIKVRRAATASAAWVVDETLCFGLRFAHCGVESPAPHHHHTSSVGVPIVLCRL